MHNSYFSHTGIHSPVQPSTTAVRDTGGDFLSSPGHHSLSLSTTTTVTIFTSSKKPENNIFTTGRLTIAGFGLLIIGILVAIAVVLVHKRRQKKKKRRERMASNLMAVLVTVMGK